MLVRIENAKTGKVLALCFSQLKIQHGRKSEIKGGSDIKRNKNKAAAGKKEKGSTWKKVLITILVILIVLVGGATGALMYLHNEGRIALHEEVSPKKEGHYVTYKGQKYKYNDDIINILCLGVDKKGYGIDEYVDVNNDLGNADANLLVSLDMEKKKVYLTAIPRDSMVDVRVYNTAGGFDRSQEAQLTTQFYYGNDVKMSSDLMMDAVSKMLYQLPIQRVVTLNMDAIPKLNDAIGGVTVTALTDVNLPSGSYPAGTEIHLEGEDALSYVQYRNTGIAESAEGRLERQKQYLLNYFTAAKGSIASDIGIPINLYNQLKDGDNMYSTLTLEDVSYLAPELISFDFGENSLYTLPGTVEMADELHEGYYLDKDAIREYVINTFYEPVTDKAEEEKN